jgi:hypothetical protein
VIAFHIGGEDNEFVRVLVKNIDRHEYISANVEIASGPFHGSYSAEFQSYSFSEFHKQLATLKEVVSGSAEFTSHEGQLEFKLECDHLGRIHVRGEARDTFRTGNRLLFNIGVDQSHVPGILSSLESVLERI